MMLSVEMLGLLAPAFIAGLIVASTHVPLGQEVLKRGIIFIDLAVAQIAALGVIFAYVVLKADYGIYPIASALIFALAAGGFFAWLEKKALNHLEALIGSTFVVSASLSILLLTNDPHGSEQMQDMLAGQILWVDWPQLFITSGIYAVLLMMWFGLKQHRRKLFYLIFPIAITLSVQLVGVYLVFASLIIPALAAVRFSEKNRLLVGYIVATAAFILGLLLSSLFDLPSGPAIVSSYALLALLTAFKKSL